MSWLATHETTKTSPWQNDGHTLLQASASQGASTQQVCGDSGGFKWVICLWRQWALKLIEMTCHSSLPLVGKSISTQTPLAPLHFRPARNVQRPRADVAERWLPNPPSAKEQGASAPCVMHARSLVLSDDRHTICLFIKQINTTTDSSRKRLW